MNFKRALSLAVALACLLPAFVGEAGGPPPPFVAAAFNAPPPPRTLSLTGETAQAAARLLGHPVHQPTVTFWREDGVTVWILTARGKAHPMTAGFVVAQGRLMNSALLESRDQRVKAVRTEAFLNQFKGATLDRDRKLDRSIDGITGASISVNAMKNMARLALYLDSLTPVPGGEDQQVDQRLER
jgi:hypothetical protein